MVFISLRWGLPMGTVHHEQPWRHCGPVRVVPSFCRCHRLRIKIRSESLLVVDGKSPANALLQRDECLGGGDTLDVLDVVVDQ